VRTALVLVLGDRVRRSSRFPDEVDRLGSISRIYSSVPTLTGNVHELYAVLWDGDSVEEVGYFEFGLCLVRSKGGQ
jgi:hypothetical protein